MIPQEKINYFYQNLWTKNIHRTKENRLPVFDHYKYSGFSLVEKIKPHEKVLDVGCMYNFFKGRIKNLIGIDPNFDEADYKVDLQSFEYPEKFDVAFCLGTIQHGDYDDIKFLIKKLISHLKDKSRIYWRLDTGTNNVSYVVENPFKWTFEISETLAREFGYTVVDKQIELDRIKMTKLYVEWSR